MRMVAELLEVGRGWGGCSSPVLVQGLLGGRLTCFLMNHKKHERGELKISSGCIYIMRIFLGFLPDLMKAIIFSDECFL